LLSLTKYILKILLSIAVVLVIILLESLPAIPQTRYELKKVHPGIIWKSYDLLIGEVGKKETGENRGIADVYNKAIGNPLGSPYCQAGQYWCYLKACAELNLQPFEIPMPRNGLANSTFDYIKKYGVKTKYNPKVHDFIIWKSPEGYTGHIERIIAVGKAGWVTTVGFNTSSGLSGSQDNGGGVWKRKRNIYHPLGRKKIRGLSGVTSQIQQVSVPYAHCGNHALSLTNV
jgi:hypothetical protein